MASGSYLTSLSFRLFNKMDLKTAVSLGVIVRTKISIYSLLAQSQTLERRRQKEKKKEKKKTSASSPSSHRSLTIQRMPVWLFSQPACIAIQQLFWGRLRRGVGGRSLLQGDPSLWSVLTGRNCYIELEPTSWNCLLLPFRVTKNTFSFNFKSVFHTSHRFTKSLKLKSWATLHLVCLVVN